ncbi:MAG: DUF362 domain-containing protein [Candidatus Atribacteria bacterium]|nr:DUF362 domain-containing protein [Candidatus Atribacteria bacterium]
MSQSLLKRMFRRIRRAWWKPRILKRQVTSGTSPPRQCRIWQLSGKPVVYSISETDLPGRGTQTGLPVIVHYFDILWNQVLAQYFTPEQHIFIKINLNTADPYPASTDIQFLSFLVDFLWTRGCHKISVGDCTSIGSLPTRRVGRKLGIEKALQGKARVVYLDEELWVKIPVKGQYLKEVTVARPPLEADRIISVVNLKTHFQAGFSLGMKAGVGFLHPLERYDLHKKNLPEKIAEINLAISPDLTIVDGRKAMITGGPSQGRVEQGYGVLVGTNLLAVEVEGYRQLYELKKAFSCLDHFPEDPFQMTQLRYGRDIGIGGMPWNGYEVVEIR